MAIGIDKSRRHIARRHIALIAAAAGALAITAAAHAEEGVTANAIIVGQSASLTGPAAALGQGARDGAAACFRQINAAGGIHGRKIELATLDDGFRPEKSAENTRTLIEKTRAFMLLGYVGGPAAMAALPIATEAKVPFVGPLNGNDALRQPFNRYVFNVRAGFNDEIERTVNTLVAIGITRIGVFHPNDTMGMKARATVESTLKQRNLPIAGAFAYDRARAEFKQAAATIAGQNPQAVILIGPPPIAVGFIREAKKTEPVPQFAAISVVTASELSAELGDAARGVMISQVVPVPTALTMSIVKEYRSAMKAAGYQDLGHASLEGCILAKVVAEGLRRAGKQPTREGLVRALESLRSFDLGGMLVTFSPTNHNNEAKFVELTAIGHGGRIVR